MKKSLLILLVLSFLLGLCACGTKSTSSSKNIYIGSESFTKEEFRDIANNNQHKFINSYVGKNITATGKITAIKGSYKSTNLNYSFDAVIVVDGFLYFEVGSSNSILDQVNVGDVVVASGVISTELYGDIYCYGDATISLK